MSSLDKEDDDAFMLEKKLGDDSCFENVNIWHKFLVLVGESLLCVDELEMGNSTSLNNVLL